MGEAPGATIQANTTGVHRVLDEPRVKTNIIHLLERSLQTCPFHKH